MLGVSVLLTNHGHEDVAVTADDERPRRHVEYQRRLLLSYSAHHAPDSEKNPEQEHDDREDQIHLRPKEQTDHEIRLWVLVPSICKCDASGGWILIAFRSIS